MKRKREGGRRREREREGGEEKERRGRKVAAVMSMFMIKDDTGT